ncbi:MAG: FmdB family zinc ribbon protein [Candidatus Nitrospinota bacterium M3_3B_026]
MPIYEYVCAECGHKFEKLTALSEAHEKQECPECGKGSGERILSLFGAGSSTGSGSGGGYCAPSGFG